MLMCTDLVHAVLFADVSESAAGRHFAETSPATH